MIIKLKTVKNLGIFSDYCCEKTTPNFKRYNLIYGWNGSGKTTLSRLFSALPSGFSDKFQVLEYELTDDAGTKIKSKIPYTNTKIMVFNQDYINENAPGLDDPSAKTKHIYLLGKHDKALAKQIDDDRKELQTLLASLDAKNKGSIVHQYKLQDDKRIALFKGAADTIAAIKGGTAIRTYNRTHAMEVYTKLTQKKELSLADLKATHRAVEQQLLESVNEISLSAIDIQKDGVTKSVDLEAFIKKVIFSVSETLKETIQQVLIERIKNHTDIAEWVAAGINLHDKHKSKKCEYCDQLIPQVRIDSLAKHFNEAHEHFLRRLTQLNKSLEAAKAKISLLQPPDKANLYSQLHATYISAVKNLETEKENTLRTIDDAIRLLHDKQTQTYKSITPLADINFTKLMSAINDVNKILDEHNKHTKAFHTSVDMARKKLEEHYVSNIYDDVRAIDSELEELKSKIEVSELQITKLKSNINNNESSIRNSKEACEDINACLTGILGRDEIIFEDHEEGYLIKRNGVTAQNLSEGEKTAIAFAYFVIHLKNKDFDFTKGIVVIDDPISSLDIEGIFRVCTLMDTKLKKAKQIIILTHNFDFFNQIKKWFMNDPSINNKDDLTDYQGEYLMIKNRYDSTLKRRVAYLDTIDPLLRDFESEYHYLFSKLVNFEKNTLAGQHGTIEAVYSYPNIARKVLECFLSFKVPQKGNMYSRMLRMSKINSAISTTDIKEVYDFINSNSHLNTKTGLIQFDAKLGANGQRYIKKTLELIKQCDSLHYDAMLKLTI